MFLEPTGPRWQDLTWLSWAGAAVYLIHNVEERGIDLLGQTYAFPTAAFRLFGFADAAHCPAPPKLFTAVNVPMFWFAGPFAALMSRRHPLVGLTIYNAITVNGVVHIVEGIATGAIYNPGWLAALAPFLPLTGWMIHGLFGKGAAVRLWGVGLSNRLGRGPAPDLDGLARDPNEGPSDDAGPRHRRSGAERRTFDRVAVDRRR